jgi:hypothetical protein
MKKLERLTVTVKATHIIKVGYSLLVTAKAEQIPSICKAMGFSLNTGRNNISEYLDIYFL